MCRLLRQRHHYGYYEQAEVEGATFEYQKETMVTVLREIGNISKDLENNAILSVKQN